MSASVLYDQLIAQYEPGRSEARDKAFAAFKAKGLPTIKDEDWRFTNPAPYLKDAYRTDVPCHGADKDALRECLDRCKVEGWDAYQVVLVNGCLDATLSVLPEDVTVMPLSKAPDGFHTIETGTYPFADLNAALYKNGLFIEVRAGSRPSKPLHVIHLYSADTPAFYMPRHLVVLHRQAELHFMESSACTNGSAPVLVNDVLECTLEDGAQLTHYVLQSGRTGERMISHTQVTQGRDSRYDNVKLCLPEADLLRNQLNVVLNGTGSECHLYGLYLPGDNQVVDNHTVVDHRQPNCESNELYKGVLQGNAKAVFNGKIFVRRPAQKTNAFQQNNNLLLGDKALVHSKPQLEIFADDVKCSHGSTIGQFNPESLFYLRARGIGEEMAKELLVQAFGADITDRVSSEAVQRHLAKYLVKERPVIHAQDVPHVEHI
ncbi:Fe-S cluster assembly protein SufD [Dinghuibacter silviterrae]|uniref:Iron-regulated ABC transporter permease protein SufD n=1 Tax=Dinghuibacter silviterrae TaxID=1539049 RepID=A0A4R8DSK3_9BACT|nr:Fe-S cluster assembly protein SufD [Dinghuibacter silviterrae]TDX01244.1 iron-regulated ABC transporter permease protein SufD [Dinghuibacter silviterrae]